MEKSAVVTTTLEQVLSQSISEQLDRVTPHPESVGFGPRQWFIFGLGVLVAVSIVLLSLGVVYISQTSQKLVTVEAEKQVVLNELVLPEIPNRAGITIELVNGSIEKAAVLEALGYQVIINPKLRPTQKTSLLALQPALASGSSVLKSDVAKLFGIATASADLKDSTASARILFGN